MSFCQTNGILNKNYNKWMMEQTSSLVETVNQFTKGNCGQGIIPISIWRIRKEKLAHERQQTEQIENELIRVWSCLEPGSSFRAHYCKKTGYSQLQNYGLDHNYQPPLQTLIFFLGP
ncbi:MAG: hypothetical protein PHP23_07630 [Desulfobacterales bacterium]|nr:hypothetical protein [Desulfobacterales bacterium]MDD4073167.1 hypothetical protein [Desulfobacterales bacterium]MDD4393111.1 hypothetical protein [Desulfobacterales bacterium]